MNRTLSPDDEILPKRLRSSIPSDRETEGVLRASSFGDEVFPSPVRDRAAANLPTTFSSASTFSLSADFANVKINDYPEKQWESAYYGNFAGYGAEHASSAPAMCDNSKLLASLPRGFNLKFIPKFVLTPRNAEHPPVEPAIRTSLPFRPHNPPFETINQIHGKTADLSPLENNQEVLTNLPIGFNPNFIPKFLLSPHGDGNSHMEPATNENRPLWFFDPASVPTEHWNPPRGPKNQNWPPLGPKNQFNPPLGPKNQYNPPLGPKNQDNPHFVPEKREKHQKSKKQLAAERTDRALRRATQKAAVTRYPYKITTMSSLLMLYSTTEGPCQRS